jgi:hypothetical protein
MEGEATPAVVAQAAVLRLYRTEEQATALRRWIGTARVQPA